MPEKIVECVPNFSEGRRPEVLTAIRESIQRIDNVFLLDQHTDADHNRTVFTFAGSPGSVSEAAFVAIQTAADLIDLEVHEGEHPRLGATDVVPFIPISGVTMEECVKLARGLGQRVGEELNIPVYLYEAAATRPERKNLEDIRRGEYEGLKESITTDPTRAPDFGPQSIGKAGATVIGARPFLIAFNVYLDTEDVSIAKKIAKTVRFSSGGLPFVKALGLLVDGLAQVSMNLTDFTQTPVAKVVEMIREEAMKYDTKIHHSELVGLIPQAALVDAVQWYMQLEDFTPDQVLETRLYAARQEDIHQEERFLDRLAAGAATPGGGSAAAYTAAMAASLVAMVARLTLGKKKYGAVQDRMIDIAREADQLRVKLNHAVSLDSEAFQSVMKAYALPKGNEAEIASRKAAIEKATHRASEVPLGVVEQVTRVLELAMGVASDGNVNAITDAGSAAALAMAAIQAAAMNVRINALATSDQVTSQAWIKELENLEETATGFYRKLKQIISERSGIVVP
jgi:glutamate formiminotransferase/formiminotetrahydrofolate cyclodeaminase